VVEMRFFGGLSVKEVAEVLKVSEETVMRDWRLAKVWLLRELGGRRTVRLSGGSRSSALPRRAERGAEERAAFLAEASAGDEVCATSGVAARV